MSCLFRNRFLGMLQMNYPSISSLRKASWLWKTSKEKISNSSQRYLYTFILSKLSNSMKFFLNKLFLLLDHWSHPCCSYRELDSWKTRSRWALWRREIIWWFPYPQNYWCPIQGKNRYHPLQRLKFTRKITDIQLFFFWNLLKYSKLSLSFSWLMKSLQYSRLSMKLKEVSMMLFVSSDLSWKTEVLSQEVVSLKLRSLSSSLSSPEKWRVWIPWSFVLSLTPWRLSLTL